MTPIGDSSKIRKALFISGGQFILLVLLSIVWYLALTIYSDYQFSNIAVSVVPGWHTTVLAPKFILGIVNYSIVTVAISLTLFIINWRFLNWLDMKKLANSAKR